MIAVNAPERNGPSVASLLDIALVVIGLVLAVAFAFWVIGVVVSLVWFLVRLALAVFVVGLVVRFVFFRRD